MEAASRSVDDRISSRPVVMPDDEPFLKELYSSTREDLAAVFPEKQMLDQMLAIQYQGQALTYAEQFPDAKHEIVMLDGEPVGRTMIQWRPDITYFIDFAVLPTGRGLGIGSWILRQTYEESRRRGVPMAFHVEKGNRAINLYLRLGIKIKADEGTHFYMVWDTDQDS